MRIFFLRKSEKFEIRLDGHCPTLKAMKNDTTLATSYATTRCNPDFKFCVLADGPFIS